MTNDSEQTADAFRTELIALLRNWVDDSRSHEVLRLFISEAGRFPHLVDEQFMSFIAPVLDKLREKAKREISRGGFRASATAVVDYPEVLLAPVLSVQIWKSLFADRRPLDVERYIEGSVDLIMSGLLPEKREDARPSDKRPGK